MTIQTTLLDKICGVAFVMAATVFAIYWMTVWIPERDAFLWTTHECFVANGCQELTEQTGINQCWSTCSIEAREGQW